MPNVCHHAGNYYSVIANMRGHSAEEVAGKILASELLRGLQVGRSSLQWSQATCILNSEPYTVRKCLSCDDAYVMTLV